MCYGMGRFVGIKGFTLKSLNVGKLDDHCGKTMCIIVHHVIFLNMKSSHKD
jgi:hypothetical protein